MVAYQPGHQIGVGLAEAMLQAEIDGVVRAQFGVVATAALGDVVEQATQVQQLRPALAQHQFVEEGQLVGEARQAHAPQVADHVEGVLVHRQGVEQVVLHVAGDLAKVGQVAAQHAVAVHAPQCTRQAVAGAEQVHEKRTRLHAVAQ